MTRRDVQFDSGSDTCAAWLYVPEGRTTPGPAIVLAHGVGAVKEMRLDAYAERFTAAGYTCLVFDYRNFGASGGSPRQVLDIGSQLADWRAAIAFVKTLPEVDADRVGIWGSSFGGGHVLTTAAADPTVKAVVAQCPFTDGLASMRATDPRSLVKVVPLAVRDLVRSATGGEPVMVGTVGKPHTTALMTAPDCYGGYLDLAPAGAAFRNEVAARFAMAITRYFPGRAARKIKVPVHFAICETDSVAPASTTLRHAQRVPQGEWKLYPFGHFDIYVGAPFEQAVADQTAFFVRHLPPG